METKKNKVVAKFRLTDHAKDRLTERLGVKPNKFDKVVRKAFLGKNILTPKVKKLEYRNQIFYKDTGNFVYRELMGYVFVFDVKDVPVLITVI